MGRHCTLCIHIDREEIDALIVGGSASNRAIANRFDVSPAAVDRHKDHLPTALLKARDAEEAARADTLLDRVELLITDARRLQAAAEKAGDLRTALAAVREVGRNLELLAKMAGELREQAAVQVNVAVGRDAPLTAHELELAAEIVAAERARLAADDSTTSAARQLPAPTEGAGDSTTSAVPVAAEVAP